MFIKSILILVGACSLAFSAAAQKLTCGNTFAQIGDSKAEITMKCGKPMFMDSFCRKPDAEPFANQDNNKKIVIVNECEPVDEWTYKPGSGQLITKLLFRNGALEKISYGSRIP